MNAVWLSDELMVSPAAVAGLIARAEDDGYGATVTLSRWVSIVLISGHEERVWNIVTEIPVGVGKEALQECVRLAREMQRAKAEAEMARLSELLWPSQPAPSSRAGIDIGIYDPELFGRPVCDATSTHFTKEEVEHCNLAAGHPGDHRYGPTFSEAHPDE